jgi:hypothetical protein
MNHDACLCLIKRTTLPTRLSLHQVCVESMQKAGRQAKLRKDKFFLTRSLFLLEPNHHKIKASMRYTEMQSMRRRRQNTEAPKDCSKSVAGYLIFRHSRDITENDPTILRPGTDVMDRIEVFLACGTSANETKFEFWRV